RRLSQRPTHPSDRLLIQLNGAWRVVDHALQWILQRRAGNPRNKNSGWENRSYCTSRAALLRCTREYCGEVDVTASAALCALTENHSDTEGGDDAHINLRALEKVP